MFRPSWRLLLVIAVVAAALLIVPSSAKAVGWGRCYSPCNWGCAPYYSVGYDPCCYGSYGWYAVGYRPGPVRRLLFGPYRWAWGPVYYSGWGGCCYDVAWSGGDCCTEAGVMAPTTEQQPTKARKPVETAPTPPQPGAEKAAPGTELPGPPGLGPAETPAPETPGTPVPATPPGLRVEPSLPGLERGTAPPPGSTMMPNGSGSALLTVWVPYDAKVTVNGLPTRSTGSRRQFVSHGLKPGFTYKYDVHAEAVRDGQVQEENQSVTLTAGQKESVAFGFNPKPTEELAANP